MLILVVIHFLATIKLMFGKLFAYYYIIIVVRVSCVLVPVLFSNEFISSLSYRREKSFVIESVRPSLHRFLLL